MKADAEIRQQGMQALIESLGLVDAERFVTTLSTHPFDYTEWRRTHLTQADSLEMLAAAANATAKSLNRS